MSQTDDKIDVVYTWVNCEDVQWQQDFQRYKTDADSKSAIHRCRFRDNGEIYFSLLSLEKFAPWINKIFIVKKRYQAPSIIHLSHHTQSKIVFVDELMLRPPEIEANDFYPTFNSLSIEANFHRIPNLSEKFIYFNNDMFLGNKVSPDYFFRDEQARFSVRKRNKVWKGYKTLKGQLTKSFAEGHKRHLMNAYELFNQTIASSKGLGINIHHMLAHQCCPLRVSSYEYLWNLPVIKEQLLMNSRSRFRSNNNLHPAYLASLVSLWRGLARVVEEEDVFIQLEKFNYRKKLNGLLTSRPVRFCINDHQGNENHIETKQFFSQLMTNYFVN